MTSFSMEVGFMKGLVGARVRACRPNSWTVLFGEELGLHWLWKWSIVWA